MKKLNEVLGEDLFSQVSEKLGESYVLVEKEAYFPKDRVDEINNQNKLLKDQLAERDTQLQSLKTKASGSDELTAKIAELEAKNKEESERFQKELNARELNYELDLALRGQGAKNSVAVKALLDLTKIALKDGKLEGLEDQINKVKTENDYLFEQFRRIPAKAGTGLEPNTPGDSLKNEFEDYLKL